MNAALTARLPGDDSTASSDIWDLQYQRPIPTIDKDEVLVKTSYVALNPYDWKGVKHRFALTGEKRVMGRDGSGVVWQTGSDVKRLRRGDRVWFCSNSARPASAAFQGYSVHHANEVGRLPENMTEEQAATFGTGLLTASVVLFKSLGLPMNSVEKSDRKPWILIWSGAASTGIFTIQLAREAGWRVICTASTVHEEYLVGLGATAVIDRDLPAEEQIEQIKSITGGDLIHAIDNIGSDTAKHCMELLHHSQSIKPLQGKRRRLVAVAGSPKNTQETSSSGVEEIRLSFSTTFYGQHDWSLSLLGYLERLMRDGKVEAGRYSVSSDGLAGIERGLADMEEGKVKGGHKSIFRVEDTPPVSQPVTVAVAPSAGKRKRSEIVYSCGEGRRLRSHQRVRVQA